MLVGITVVLAAGIGLMLATMIDPPSATHAELAFASDDDGVALRHVGGEPLGLGTAQAHLLIDGDVHTVQLIDCPGAAAGEPELLENGETLTIVSPSARCTGLPGGQLTEIRIVVGGHGERQLTTSWEGQLQIPP